VEALHAVVAGGRSLPVGSRELLKRLVGAGLRVRKA
jgi:hypothetical protein